MVVRAPIRAPARDGDGGTGTPPKTANHIDVEFTLCISYGGRQRAIPVPMTAEMFTHMVLQADFRGIPLGDYIAHLVSEGLRE